MDERAEFLTARQLASVLQVSESTVRRLAQEGRIPAMRITSRIIRFHLQSVRDALDGTDRMATRTHRRANEPQKENPQLSFTDLLLEGDERAAS